MEAMNNGYFAASNVGGGSGIVSVDLGSGATVTAVELAAYFAGNHHLSGPARRQEERFGAMTPPDVDMGCRFDGAGGGSCSAASLRCLGQSDGMAVWPPSSKAPAYSIWSSSSSASDRPRTGSVYEPSYLAGIPDAAGFRYSHACSGGGGPSAPSTSALSLTLCSQSSSDSVLHTADGCSSVASRSALTELPQASHPPARSTPAPFATVVARSRYAAVAQEVLNDFVGRLLDGVSDSGTSGIDSWSVDASSEDAGARAQRVRTDLLNLLEMVDQKYNQCLDEIRSTTAKFNGLMPHGSASNGSSIRAQFAHRVSSMYLGLKRRIAGEIMAASRPTCWGESSSATAGHMERSWESASIQKRAAAARRGEQQSWLPHRGLPERSVAVLKAWMFEHFLKPYPDDREKDMLALRTGLTRAQVSNWFINARVRIWKPLIEEMYKDLERSSAGERGMGMEARQNLMGRAIVLEGGP